MSSGLRHGPSRSMMLVMVTLPMVSCFMLFPSRGEATAAAVVFAPSPLAGEGSANGATIWIGGGVGCTPSPTELVEHLELPSPAGGEGAITATSPALCRRCCHRLLVGAGFRHQGGGLEPCVRLGTGRFHGGDGDPVGRPDALPSEPRDQMIEPVAVDVHV